MVPEIVSKPSTITLRRKRGRCNSSLLYEEGGPRRPQAGGTGGQLLDGNRIFPRGQDDPQPRSERPPACRAACLGVREEPEAPVLQHLAPRARLREDVA